MKILFDGLAWVFGFWMVADCLRRYSGGWRIAWIAFIILLRPFPLGAALYLVLLLITDRTAKGDPALRGKPGESGIPSGLRSPGQLLSNVTAIRGGDPALDLADQMEAQERYGEASLIYRRSLEQKGDTPRALHGLARCLAELGEAREAMDRFATLMEIEPRYRNYTAALEYAEVLHRAGHNDDAVGLMEGLAQETSRINHQVALAHYLELGGKKERARETLRRALAQYEEAPEPEQIAARQWHRRIVDKLEDLSLS